MTNAPLRHVARVLGRAGAAAQNALEIARFGGLDTGEFLLEQLAFERTVLPQRLLVLYLKLLPPPGLGRQRLCVRHDRIHDGSADADGQAFCHGSSVPSVVEKPVAQQRSGGLGAFEGRHVPAILDD